MTQPLVAVAAFVSASAAITWTVGYLNRHSLAVSATTASRSGAIACSS